MPNFQDAWSHAGEFVNNLIDVVIPPDTLLPCQMPHTQSRTPEAALLSDVYRDALWRLERSYKCPSPCRLRERGEVFSWIYGDPAFVSFQLLCEHFDIDPPLLRDAIIKWCREMEGGTFRNIIVRASPVRTADAQLTNTDARYERKLRQQRPGRMRAAMEVQS